MSFFFFFHFLCVYGGWGRRKGNFKQVITVKKEKLHLLNLQSTVKAQILEILVTFKTKTPAKAAFPYEYFVDPH